MHGLIEAYASPHGMPSHLRARFKPAFQADYFSTLGWYETVVSSGIPPGMRPIFLVALDGRLILPLLANERGVPVQSLTTPYSCLFAPLISDELSDSDIKVAGSILGRSLQKSGLVRLDALAADDERGNLLIRAMSGPALLATRFDHFGNWCEPVAGMTWDGYLAGRAGALKETVRRKLRKVEKDRSVRFRMIVGGLELDDGISEYEYVYARSWKDKEPFPDFTATFMRQAARDGVLRLGLLSDGEIPIATQLWTVTGSVASVLKLAHDDDFKPLSPGTVLTALMMRHLIDTEHVGVLDFGRGDDPYKQLWATQRNQRTGVVLANPWTVSGAAHLARHGVGVVARGLRIARQV